MCRLRSVREQSSVSACRGGATAPGEGGSLRWPAERGFAPMTVRRSAVSRGLEADMSKFHSHVQHVFISYVFVS